MRITLSLLSAGLFALTLLSAPQAQAASAAPVSASASANGLLSGDMAFERGKTGSRGRRGTSKKGG